MTKDGYAQAYQRGYDITVRFLLSRGMQRDNASEVAQAAWVRGWERLGQLRNESLVVTWVNTIALNVYRSFIRREPINMPLLEQHLDKSRSIDLAAIDIARALSFCRPSDRHLLEQSMNGATTAQLAGEHGVSENAIRIRLLRARRDVRSRIERKNTPSSSLVTCKSWPGVTAEHASK
jgi:DNA-directed RNA polymerase specialized sigma24 family protein